MFYFFTAPVAASAGRYIPSFEKSGDWLIGCGTLALGFGTAAIAMKSSNMRTTHMFRRSLISQSLTELTDIHPYYPRPKLDILSVNNAVILKGPHRSGKTVYMAHAITNLYPWYFRYVFPARGFYLVGNQANATAQKWFKQQVNSADTEDPVGSMMATISNRYRQQVIRQCFAK